jgi:hypothetical protein
MLNFIELGYIWEIYIWEIGEIFTDKTNKTF